MRQVSVSEAMLDSSIVISHGVWTGEIVELEWDSVTCSDDYAHAWAQVWQKWAELHDLDVMSLLSLIRGNLFSLTL